MEKEKLNENLTEEVAGGKIEPKPFHIGDPVVEREDFCSKCGKLFKTRTIPWAPLGKEMCEACLEKENFGRECLKPEK